MPVRITGIENHSPCSEKGVRAGDLLVSVNSHEINDVLDYRFFIAAEKLNLEIQHPDGKRKTIKIHKNEYDEPGLLFETYLMDKQRRCANNCIFCFIDQLPEGLRDSLYFKDDDSRLSFLFGNYITLTNLSRHEADRIMQMHISPVNVSVHTMNASLRVAMMRNRFAGDCLSYLPEFANAGIRLNTQLVLCPGINDGKELEFSLSELLKLYPSVQSIAAVPVGLTEHRDGLYKISEYTSEKAAEVIDIIDDFNKANAANGIPRIAFAADEFYIKAQRDIPQAEYYCDFPQLENGVGMWALMKDEFFAELSELPCDAKAQGRRATIATGAAAYPLIRHLAEELCSKVDGLQVDVVKIVNKFFGESITVSGLLTGTDYLSQLRAIDIGDELLIPSSSLRREGDMFLDNMTPEELSVKLNVKVTPVGNDGAALLHAMLGN